MNNLLQKSKYESSDRERDLCRCISKMFPYSFQISYLHMSYLTLFLNVIFKIQGTDHLYHTVDTTDFDPTNIDTDYVYFGQLLSCPINYDFCFAVVYIQLISGHRHDNHSGCLEQLPHFGRITLL